MSKTFFEDCMTYDVKWAYEQGYLSVNTTRRLIQLIEEKKERILKNGTVCDYCGNDVLKELGLDYIDNGKVFCCKECADDYKELLSQKDRKIESLEKELEDWKELFFLLKEDHELLENFQTNDWMVKARKIGLHI